MKIFIDTADLDEIKEACSWGIVNGATTNPSLIKKAVDKRKGKITMDQYIREIIETVPGPVSLEVIALEANQMIEQAELLYRKFNPYGDVAIKIPVNPHMNEKTHDFDGLKAIKKLDEKGIRVNATLIMTPEQALLAAKAGAAYVSPFAGRIDDFIRIKMGMKINVDFQKMDYFNSTLIHKIADYRLSKGIGEPNYESRLHELIKTDVSTGHDNGVYSGVDLIRIILNIFRKYKIKTELIAASIRNARQVRDVAELGADIATIPFNVLKEMIRHYKTAEGVKNFTKDIVPAYETLFKD